MFKTVSEIIKLQRLTICNNCDDFNKKIKTCKQCGCYMPAKTMFAASECPLSKWKSNVPGNDLINQIDEAILNSWNKL
jgi:hypothetical protein